MPNNRKTTLKNIKGHEGVHPGSRKARQITRVHLRNAKLVSAKKVRKDLYKGKLFRPLFFMQQLKSDAALTLPELRSLVQDVFLARHDGRIAELEAERRPGRPKAKELLELEELKRVENAEFETGFEVLDLTDPKATRLLYKMIVDETRMRHSHIDIMPQVRLFKNDPETKLSSKAGNLMNMGLGGELPDILMKGGDDESDDEMEE